MKSSFANEDLSAVIAPLQRANDEFTRQYPGETGRRQPVHTVYGGAPLFKADSAQRLGSVAQRSLDQFAPDAITFAEALNIRGADPQTIYNCVVEKIKREPVED